MCRSCAIARRSAFFLYINLEQSDFEFMKNADWNSGSVSEKTDQKEIEHSLWQFATHKFVARISSHNIFR